MNSFIRYGLRRFNVTRKHPDGLVETVTVWAEIEHEAKLIGKFPGTGQTCEIVSCEQVGRGVVAKIHAERISTETPVFTFPSPAA